MPAAAPAETEAPAEEPEAEAEPVAQEAAEPEEELSFDEPWLDTAACTTCDDCMSINKMMFAYNEDKQAYIRDAKAGTYADLVAAAREAGDILLRHYRGGTESWEKSEDNPVTLADLESDRAIAARLRAAFPEDGMLSEESVSDPVRVERRRVWIVDPMDGTKEFTKKIPEFAASRARASTSSSSSKPGRVSSDGF